MRLNYRYTIAYSLITFFVLLIGLAIVYTAVKRSSAQATIGELKHLNRVVANQLSSSSDYSGHPSRKNVTIEKLTGIPNTTEKVDYRIVWNEELQNKVMNVSLATIHQVGTHYYRITSHTFMIITEDIYLNGIFMVFAWTFIFLISMVIISSEVISGYILAPFNATLYSIQKFALHQQTNIKFQKTSTLEFQELNRFLLKMTENAKKDYWALKEFSENASHELQTPIAVIKAKIELLIQSKLDESQLTQLMSMLDELEKLSKINQSLTLLTKLENFQANTHSVTDISSIVSETLLSFADLIEMKQITVKSHLIDSVYILMEESLSRILLNNLLSNAIRHNWISGSIEVIVSPSGLMMRNTGNQPLVPTEELFGRFKKDNQSLNSIGIGLAIVKKICEIFGHTITYQFIAGYHTIEIAFVQPEK